MHSDSYLIDDNLQQNGHMPIIIMYIIHICLSAAVWCIWYIYMILYRSLHIILYYDLYFNVDILTYVNVIRII